MSSIHRCYVFYKLLIVDEHSQHTHADTRSLSIQFVIVYLCLCMCGRKKENFEGYESCAHFRGALSIPHQHCYQIDNNNNKTTATHHQRKMTTTKIATHTRYVATRSTGYNAFFSLFSISTVGLSFLSL